MKLKKVLAVVSTAVAVIVGTMSGASALNAPAGYDVNGDGFVNISDAVAINMALIGNWKPSDLSDIDVNQNGVVDDLDRTSIMAYVTMVGILTITMQ